MTFDLSQAQLRPAVAEQASAVAPLIFDTDPALWRWLFCRDLEGAVLFFEEEWQVERSTFSYSFGTAVVLDGDLMGIEQGFDRQTEDEYRSESGKRGGPLLSPETAHGVVANIATYGSYLVPPIPEGVYYVQFLAVAPQARGHGLGRRLLDNAFERAEQQGYSACHLDVASENRAVGFYLQMGMEILSECRVVPLEEHGVHSHFRMVKAL